MLLEIFSTIFLIFILNFLLIKKNFLIDLREKSKHKQLTGNINKKVPLAGGIIILLILNFFNFQNFFFLFITSSILILGILSDLDILRSPKKRILIQSIIIIIYLIYSGIYFDDLRLAPLNAFLDYYPIAIGFNLFCILILLNGTNLIDGVNNSVVGYFLSVSLILLVLSIKYNLNLNTDFISTIMVILSAIYIFNFFGKLYLGDGGSYLISFIFSFILIKFYIDNPSVSPYFVMCLLWYPAFENLFSIIRKKINQISFETPDKKHFHHFLFNFIGLKIRINKEIANTISGNLIAIYNLIYFFIIKDYYFFTLGLVFSCIINIFLYIFVYFFLSKKN